MKKFIVMIITIMVFGFSTDSFALNQNETEVYNAVLGIDTSISLGDAMVNYNMRDGQVRIGDVSTGGRTIVQVEIFESMKRCNEEEEYILPKGKSILDVDRDNYKTVLPEKKWFIFQMVKVKDPRTGEKIWKMYGSGIYFLYKGKTHHAREFEIGRIDVNTLKRIYAGRCF